MIRGVDLNYSRSKKGKKKKGRMKWQLCEVSELSGSVVSDFVTPWTAACQASLSSIITQGKVRFRLASAFAVGVSEKHEI